MLSRVSKVLALPSTHLLQWHVMIYYGGTLPLGSQVPFVHWSIVAHPLTDRFQLMPRGSLASVSAWQMLTKPGSGNRVHSVKGDETLGGQKPLPLNLLF